MDELTLDDKIYISSKQAAKITGYAKDYIGQLCREGRVEARLVGRSWYVLEESLKSHRFTDKRKAEVVTEEEEAEEAVKAVTSTETEPTEIPTISATPGESIPVVSDIASIQAVLSTPRYTVEEPESISTIDQEPKMSEEGVRQIEHLQDAWSSWFTYGKEEVPQAVETREPVVSSEGVSEREYEAPEEAQTVPVRRVIEAAPPAPMDIAPARHAEPYFAPVLEEATVLRERIVPRKAPKVGQKGGSRVAYALILAGIVLIVIVTTIVTGFSEELLASPADGPLLDFLQGETKIDK